MRASVNRMPRAWEFPDSLKAMELAPTTLEGGRVSAGTRTGDRPLLLGGGQPYAADKPDAVRGLGLEFSLPDGELWRTAMINLPVFPVRTPEAFTSN